MVEPEAACENRSGSRPRGTRQFGFYEAWTPSAAAQPEASVVVRSFWPTPAHELHRWPPVRTAMRNVLSRSAVQHVLLAGAGGPKSGCDGNDPERWIAACPTSECRRRSIRRTRGYGLQLCQRALHVMVTNAGSGYTLAGPAVTRCARQHDASGHLCYLPTRSNQGLVSASRPRSRAANLRGGFNEQGGVPPQRPIFDTEPNRGVPENESTAARGITTAHVAAHHRCDR